MEEIMENEVTTEQQEKTFTQEEVNRIVKERLARLKAKYETDSETTEEESQLDEREKAIALRENRVTCMEYVAENGNIDEWNKYIYQCLNSAKALKELLVNNGLETNFAIVVMDFDKEVVYIYILNDQVSYNIRNEN